MTSPSPFRRRLGRTDLEISPIGLGFMQFSGGVIGRGMWGAAEQATADAVVAAARSAGITLFDTAEIYGSEPALSHALQAGGAAPADVVVATKWTPFFRTARDLARSGSHRRAALAPYPISLYQIHAPASFSSIPAQMRALAALVRAGEVRAVGVSNFSADQMARASLALADEGMVLASNQVRISLIDRRIERNDVLAAAREMGVTLIAYGPLAGGVLTGRFHDGSGHAAQVRRVRRLLSPYPYDRRGLERVAPLVGALREIADAHGVRPGQVALRWLTSAYGETVVAIPGASRPEQAAQAGEAMGLELTDSEIERLSELGARP